MLRAVKKAGIQAMEQTAPAGVLLGVVKAINPLVITVEQRLDIPAEFLLLTDNVRDYKVSLSFDNPGIKNIVKPYGMDDVPGTEYKISFQDAAKNEITVYNGLTPGEKVVLLRVQGGQKFIVLNRVVSG